ncbi:uncharacterized protein SPPG_04154 [Spizellomyces punctatus DAOM BR117]|uniref:Talin N-terminal F0 domain-containing protein n=1 Tax=Spizellomyces punctatus (strain DAOM BR117) TaxID=645134 RepID=A0A0L0HJ04_SPIPD|nr:uncharacterized protein SPPG_04154 [Spizellomyces punctatus DAOM BR117]KND01062.1 hypothetical protein SPPG_04154 [Spizellomyces punctatus DAOM BR117]|eukprot:XP_016609101.1 hypothetical protein SPPG_04154 [Spizellomyces punctatus DAOM BR117]
MSTPTITTPPAAVVLRISLPSHDWQKAIKANLKDMVWSIKKQIIEKMASTVDEALNFGLYLPADVKSGKQGKFLDEKRELGTYVSESNTFLEFIPKHRILASSATADSDAGGGSPSLNSKKKQKKFVEDVQKGSVDKVKEKGVKGFDPNFWTEAGDTPLTIAVMNNDKDMISTLIENGALLDYRIGKRDGWKTPLHVAAQNNKITALQTLIGYGAWVNCPDAQNLTPLYYAAVGGHHECVLRLLIARADTDIYDETGKGPLHIACFNNHEAIASLLIDHGANLNTVNAVGNTPLHVAATRNAKECAKWLVMRGCERERTNKSGQTPLQLASMSGNVDIAELIKKFTNDMIVPPPPKPLPVEDGLSPLPGTNNRRDTFMFAPHLRSASAEVDRRISYFGTPLSSGTPEPHMIKSPSSASIATSASGSTKRESAAAPSRKRATARLNRIRKVGSAGIPPPPSTPKPGISKTVDTVLIGQAQGVENPKEAESTPLAVSTPPATPPPSQTSTPDIKESKPSSTTHSSAGGSAAASPIPSRPMPRMGPSGARSPLISLFPPPSLPPPPHLMLQSGQTDRPTATPPKPTPPPIVTPLPKETLQIPQTPSTQTPRTPTKSETQHIINMLRQAMESGEEGQLEVDLETLLESYTALEVALEDAHRRLVAAEEEIKSLRAAKTDGVQV